MSAVSKMYFYFFCASTFVQFSLVVRLIVQGHWEGERVPFAATGERYTTPSRCGTVAPIQVQEGLLGPKTHLEAPLLRPVSVHLHRVPGCSIRPIEGTQRRSTRLPKTSALFNGFRSGLGRKLDGISSKAAK